jgi:Subtilase family
MENQRSGRVRGALAGGLLALCAFAPAARAADAGPSVADKVGSQLRPLLLSGASGADQASEAGATIERGRALVDVYVRGGLDRAVDRLEGAGMNVEATATDPLPVAEGWIPADRLAAGAGFASTRAVLPVIGGQTDVGAVTSEGVGAHNLPAAIASTGASGAGVDVGVISDSIDRVGGGVDDSQATGDLPPDPRVVVLNDDTTGGTADEGRAMAEIIYDEAPGLNRILFSTGTATGPVGKAASINALVANGADVIGDDIFYLEEPFFQDGTVAQAVDTARSAGVAYFASAGNRARQSYESNYRDSAGLHDFDPGAGTDTRSCFNTAVQDGDFILIALQWAEPWGQAQTNLDLRITTSAGTVLASSTTNNITTGIPRETAVFGNNTGGPVTPCVEIPRVAGTGTPFMKWIEFDNTPGSPVPEFDTASNTINPDAASAGGSLSVAAVDVDDAGHDTPETFSSRGPNTRFFNAAGVPFGSPQVRANPDLAAADGVSTTVPAFPTFFGTSAATPSAAGIAAVLRSAGASTDQIYSRMTNPTNAIDCTLTGGQPDTDCGAGFVLANLAVAGLDGTPPVVSTAVDPAVATGSNGWYTGDVTVSLSAADAQSTVQSANGCGNFPVADGVKTFTCTAVSSGGTGSGSVTVKRDSQPPSKPKIKGIKKHGKPPPKGKLKCKSTDATSGVASCTLKGYSRKPGKHTVRATATDNAGLTSKSKLKYKVE